MSQAGPCGRDTPRCSVGGVGGQISVPVSMAGLPGASACVCVGPPLPASGASSEFADVMLTPHVEPGNCMLVPPFPTLPEQLLPVLFAMMVLVTFRPPPPYWMPPPLLLAMVDAMMSTPFPKLNSPPPAAAVFVLIVTFDSATPIPLLYRPPPLPSVEF